jgi:RNA polymerase sigma-70 factor (ECF subfamily)
VSDTDERDLLRQLAAGDEAALEALFLDHAESLQQIARAYLRSSALARDVVQDVFTAVWLRRQTIAFRGPARAYLAIAVRNRARTLIRETLRRHERETRWADGQPTSTRDDDTVHQSPDRRHMLSAIAAALSELPERQRIVVRLRVREGMSPAEVRAAIGAVSVKAVERIYARAIEALRAKLLH